VTLRYFITKYQDVRVVHTAHPYHEAPHSKLGHDRMQQWVVLLRDITLIVTIFLLVFRFVVVHILLMKAMACSIQCSSQQIVTHAEHNIIILCDPLSNFTHSYNLLFAFLLPRIKKDLNKL